MNSSVLKWLFAVPGKRKLYILLLMLMQAVYGASGVFYALLLRGIVDHAAAGDRNGFFAAAVRAVLLILAQVMLWAGIRLLNDQTKASFENLFKKRLTEQLMKKDYARVSAVHSGEWLNRLTNDARVVAEHYTDILPGLSGMAVKLLSAVVMMIALDRRFALILLPGGAVMIVLTYAFRKIMKRLHKNVQEQDGRLRILLQERIGSLLMIKSCAAEAQTLSAAESAMKRHLAASMRRTGFSVFCNIGFLTAFSGMYLFGVCYCSYGILLGTVTYGTLTAITQLISQIQTPFANITGYLPKLYAMTASAERLQEIEQFENDSDIPALSAEEIGAYYGNSLRSFGLEQADFTYDPVTDSPAALSKDNQPEVLRHLSIEIGKGEYVAFTGQSGCGKSTVLKLLMSIYRLDGGERFLTGSDGRHPLTAAHRRLFAYVPQGNQLMSGTVRDIVTFAAPQARDDEQRLHNALKIACADFVQELEQGADTLLGERGTGLSEGQMQRIAIARAVFSGSPVLLLDEATSALDSVTEQRLLENLRSMTDKTVVIVTHRPAALQICDRILEFTENGVLEQHEHQ